MKPSLSEGMQSILAKALSSKAGRKPDNLYRRGVIVIAPARIAAAIFSSQTSGGYFQRLAIY